MRRLVGHQELTIALDSEGGYGDGELVDCVLERVRGPVATVAACGEVGARVRDRLRAGALAFLTFEHFGASVALRGAARAVSDGAAIEFVVLDGVELAERRKGPRVALETRVRAVLLADGVSAAAIDTLTADLSIGGALLKRQRGLGEGPWQIELFLPGDRTPVRCAASLVRQTASHLSVAFAEIEDVDLIRLEKAVADHPAAAAEAVIGISGSETPAVGVGEPVPGIPGFDDAGVAAVRDGYFELIVDSIPQIVFIASRYGSTEYFNQRGTEYMGLPREKTRGWAWTAMLHEDDVERVAAAWREAAAGEASYQIEYRLRRYDGEFRWHQCRAMPVRAVDGEVVKWIGTLIDIEDQRRLEQSLRASERRAAESLSLLQALQATAPAGLGFVDRDFRLVHINEMLAMANGAPREQLLGLTLAEVMPGLWSSLEPLFRRVLESGEAALNHEITRELPGDQGRVGTALTSFYPVRLDGQVIGIGIVVLDITERKEMELQLKKGSERDPQTAGT
jgi:PAS domain S-box-containing protein